MGERKKKRSNSITSSAKRERFRLDRESEVLGGFQIEDELEYSRLLGRQAGGFFTFEDTVYIGGRAAKDVRSVGPIGHQSAFDRLARSALPPLASRYAPLQRYCREQRASDVEERVGVDHEPWDTSSGEVFEAALRSRSLLAVDEQQTPWPQCDHSGDFFIVGKRN